MKKREQQPKAGNGWGNLLEQVNVNTGGVCVEAEGLAKSLHVGVLVERPFLQGSSLPAVVSSYMTIHSSDFKITLRI